MGMKQGKVYLHVQDPAGGSGVVFVYILEFGVAIDILERNFKPYILNQQTPAVQSLCHASQQSEICPPRFERFHSTVPETRGSKISDIGSHLLVVKE